MSKKIYALPLQKTKKLLHAHKDTILRLTHDKQFLEYTQHFGRGYYEQQIERFITFFKIDRELGSALQTITFFHSKTFFDKIWTHLELQHYCGCDEAVKKTFFYGVCYLWQKADAKLFAHFFEKLFIHYHEGFQPQSAVSVNFQEMARDLCKRRKITLKESFGEDEKGAYFMLLADGKSVVEERGKSIKTLRKKAYKQLFFLLLDHADEMVQAKQDERQATFEELQEMKRL